jgi:serine/threonine protein kinase/tetratricopeptide (TPR) repeat protein
VPAKTPRDSHASDNSRVDSLVARWEVQWRQGQTLSAAELCRDNPELLTQVEQRIQAFLGLAPFFMHTDDGDTCTGRNGRGAVARPEVAGYEILEELGRGGMGVVYKARHLKLNRIVALKMILAGLHRRIQDQQRFLAEAEAVAGLQHPNIVQLYEFGQQDNLPYFTLEYMAGGSLAGKLRQGPLPAQEAAALIETLAQGMQHAHLHGIIHRDLKPANVLLQIADRRLQTGDCGTPNATPSANPQSATGNRQSGSNPQSAIPKISDFGLVKRLESGDGPTTSGAVLGTPSYMAPEQARGETRQVGPAADIYALGAILYECLTGRPPFRGPTVLETLQQVMDSEPVPPRRLQPNVPRDLETICLKCLEKEPGKRYATAADLGADVHRFQTGEPISARPVGSTERAWRWCRRRPVVAALSVGLLLLLMISVPWLITLTVLAENRRVLAEEESAAAQQARHQADEEKENAFAQERAALSAKKLAEDKEKIAKTESLKAKEFSDLLLGVFESADPLGLQGYTFSLAQVGGSELTAREILDRAVKKIQSKQGVASEIQAAHLASIGNVYRSLGHFKEAQKLLEQAHAMRQKVFGAENEEIADNLFFLGWLYQEQGHYPKAMKYYDEALQMRKKLLGANHPKVTTSLFNKAWLLVWMGQHEEAESILQDVITRRLKEHGTELHRDVAVAKAGLAMLYLSSGKYKEGQKPGLEALAIFHKVSPEDKLVQAVDKFLQAMTSANVLRLPALAEKQLRESIELTAGELGKNHPYLAVHWFQLADVMEAQKKPDEAEKCYRECLKIVRATTGLGHPKACMLVRSLGNLLLRMGRFNEAVALFDELKKAHEDRFGKDHPLVADVLIAYAELPGKQMVDERMHVLQRAVDIYAHSKERYDTDPPRSKFKSVLAQLSVACWRAKAVREGLQTALKRREFFRNDSQELFDAACEAAYLIPVAKKDTSLDTEKRQKLVADCLHLSLEMLHESLAKGFDDPTRLLVDSRLSPIASNPKFEALFKKWPAFAVSQVKVYRDQIAPHKELDKKTKGWFKTYPVHFEVGKTYQIDLVSVEFDAYLRVLDDKGVERAWDDDSGGNLNARLLFQPKQTGQYIIVATSFHPGQFGGFVLAIQEKH